MDEMASVTFMLKVLQTITNKDHATVTSSVFQEAVEYALQHISFLLPYLEA